jgi:membrane protein implicated in regulation of membrane protease activity
MTDRIAIDTVAADCERYWRAAGIKRRIAAEMRAELEQHLIEASMDGRTPESVVGADTSTFAIEWAEATGRSQDTLPTWDEVFRRRKRRFNWADLAILAIVAGAIVIGLATRGEGDGMDTETWRWIWIGAALFLGLAEMMTAGFFMLPFAVGAVIAAALAFMDVAPAIQMAVFIATSLVALILLQRFVRHGDEGQHPIGANRFIGRTAVVLEEIERTATAGRVRMDTEEWRATTDGDSIAIGTEVRILEVRGTRLVVEPTD